MLYAVKRWLLLMLGMLVTLLPLTLFAADDEETTEFPGRPLYPEVSVIELDELFRRLDEVIESFAPRLKLYQ